FLAGKGVHYVKVTAGQATNPSLTYRVNVIINNSAACEVEPNNTASDATAVNLISGATNCKIYGFAAIGDIDYYKLVSPAPGYMQLDIINDNGVQGDYDVKIVQILGANILEESVLCSFTVSTGGDTVNSSTTVNLDKGNYYVIVSPKDSTYGGYAVDIFYKTEPKRETEFNNNKESADLIPMNDGEVMTATLSAENDVDMFKVVTSKITSCELTFNAHKDTVSQGSWQVAIFEDDGTTPVEGSPFTFSKDKPASKSLAKLDDGTYYIKVTKGSIYESGRYTITLKTVKPDNDCWFIKLIKAILALNWAGAGESIKQSFDWIKQVNIIGMLVSIGESLYKIIPYIISRF
nr:hypothetical protein [Clostridiales bacterium]